jgi:eukaryotic-like serine/threonine-protein kinase
MTPDRWERVKELFDAALERSPEERSGFLVEACAGDDGLRGEVRRLLAEHNQAGEFLNSTPWARTVGPGTTLGSYHILERLGCGGMGEVYLAHDPRLDRHVAIKVLPVHLTSDAVARERLHREAMAAAALDHPFICKIFEIGQSDGILFCVMEYVRGETLQSRLRGGRLAQSDALRIAEEIAEALEEAHAKKFVHRDLKPANVMLTPQGRVKVMDFGLAKRVASGELKDISAALTASDLLSSAEGVVCGTPEYMSPEQVKGAKVDPRSDLFSFGIILCELLTRKHPFRRNTAIETLTAILHDPPDLAVTGNVELPLGLMVLIRRLVAKSPDDRYQSISEVHADLKPLTRELESGRSSRGRQRGPVGPTKRKLALYTAAAAVLTLLAVGAGFYVRAPQANRLPSAELTQKRLTFNSSGNPVENGAISPEGKYLAYSDVAGIHVKLLSTSEERLIPRPGGVPASAGWDVASWFPDGTQLLANANEVGGHKSMWTVSLLGQSARELREDALGWEVSRDGTHIVFTPAAPSGYVREIWVMGSQGDTPQEVLALGENEWLSSIHWSPDGQRLAYIRWRQLSFAMGSWGAAIETCDLKGANRTVVVPAEHLSLQDYCWLPGRRIVYSRQESPGSNDDNLWQISVDDQTGVATDKPRRVTQWAGSYLQGLSASADGKRLVLQKLTYQAQVYLGELAAGGTRINPPRQLTNDEANDRPTAWTADSKAVLFTSDRNGADGIFKQGINQNTAEPVVTGPQSAAFPRLSPDGAWMLYWEFPKTVGPTAESPRPFGWTSAPLRLMRIPVSGGVPQFVLESRNALSFGCAAAPAILCVLYEASQDKRQLTLTAFDPLRGKGKVLRTIEKEPSTEYFGSKLAPDGSTFAISTMYEAAIHIQLLSLSGGSDREITVKGWPNGEGLDWSPGGKGLYLGSVSPQSRTLLYVDLKGNARVLWQFKGAGGSIWGIPSPDGRYLATLGSIFNSNVWMLEGF